jgi:hypothetical protein
VIDLQKPHRSINVACTFNWVFLAKNQDDPSSLIDEKVNLLVVNSKGNGITLVKLPKDSSCSPKLEYLDNNYANKGSKALENWLVYDVLELENKILLIAGSMGLYELKFSSTNKTSIKLLTHDNYY